MIKVKRIYEAPARSDGHRVLVDRLWPRGKSKEKARIDLWLKEVAPSNELRKWYGHEPAKWGEFRKRYFAELSDKEDLLAQLEGLKGTVTLLFSSKELKLNNAVALKEHLEKRKKKS